MKLYMLEYNTNKLIHSTYEYKFQYNIGSFSVYKQTTRDPMLYITYSKIFLLCISCNKCPKEKLLHYLRVCSVNFRKIRRLVKNTYSKDIV